MLVMISRLARRAWRCAPGSSTTRCGAPWRTDACGRRCCSARASATRPWRVAGELEAVYELDAPAVPQAKDALLGERPLALARRRAAVPCDLACRRWAESPRDAGFDPRLPAVFLAEGLLYYLAPRAVGRLLSTAAALAAPGSALALSAVNGAALSRARRGRSAARRTWRWSTDAPADDLAGRGWRAECVRRPGEPECAFGRMARPPALDNSQPQTWYVVARRAADA